MAPERKCTCGKASCFNAAPVCTCEVEIDMHRWECRVFMCPLHQAAPELYAALEEMLRYGQHEGACNVGDGTCELHLAASEARAIKARAALAKANPEKWGGKDAQ